jgi:hypothetical protein
MQFIQMAQMVRQNIGLQGTGPSTITATGAEGVMIQMVKDSWEDIQNHKADWKWMRESVAFNTVVGTATYIPTTIFGPIHRFQSWYKDTFFASVNGKKVWIPFRDYDYFRYVHINDTVRTAPNEFTIRPKDYAFIIQAPDLIYPIEAHYHKSNQSLVNATDIPEMPIDYHRLIVYEATARYALSIALGHIYDLYSQKAVELWGELLREQNPRKAFKVRGIA